MGLFCCDVEKINVSWKVKGLHLQNKLIFLLRKEQRHVLFGKKKCILLRNDCVVVCSISLHITLVHTHKRTPKHNIRVLCSFGKGKYILSLFFLHAFCWNQFYHCKSCCHHPVQFVEGRWILKNKSTIIVLLKTMITFIVDCWFPNGQHLDNVANFANTFICFTPH